MNYPELSRYKLVRKRYNVFMVGLIASVIAVVVASMFALVFLGDL